MFGIKITVTRCRPIRRDDYRLVQVWGAQVGELHGYRRRCYRFYEVAV